MNSGFNKILGKLNVYYLVTIVFIVIYAAFIFMLIDKRLLSVQDALVNAAVLLGWLFAFVLAIFQLNKTRHDNRSEKIYELRKSLEIDAFRAINQGVTDFLRGTSGASNLFLSLPGELEMHVENPTIFKFNAIEISQKIRAQQIKFGEGHLAFIFAVEANEIAVIQFDHFRKYIYLRTRELDQLLMDFLSYFTLSEAENLKKNEGKAKFKTECEKIYGKIGDIQSYLHDYRIELMNEMLSEVFDRRIPVRNPLDPQFQVLTSIATKQKVDEELAVLQAKDLDSFRRKEQ